MERNSERQGEQMGVYDQNRSNLILMLEDLEASDRALVKLGNSVHHCPAVGEQLSPSCNCCTSLADGLRKQ